MQMLEFLFCFEECDLKSNFIANRPETFLTMFLFLYKIGNKCLELCLASPQMTAYWIFNPQTTHRIPFSITKTITI